MYSNPSPLLVCLTGQESCGGPDGVGASGRLGLKGTIGVIPYQDRHGTLRDPHL